MEIKCVKGGSHTYLGASYFAMALIATAASSVMADSTVIWESTGKGSHVWVQSRGRSTKNKAGYKDGGTIPGSLLHSRISAQSPCQGLPQADGGPLAPPHCLGAVIGTHPGCQSARGRQRRKLKMSPSSLRMKGVMGKLGRQTANTEYPLLPISLLSAQGLWSVSTSTPPRLLNHLQSHHLHTWKSFLLMLGTSILWVDGQISSYFFPVKMSIPTRWTCMYTSHQREIHLYSRMEEILGWWGEVTLGCQDKEELELNQSTQKGKH